MSAIDISKIETSLSPIDGNLPVLSEYDVLWGFYLIDQKVAFSYNENKLSGYSRAEVNILGKFTINGEIQNDLERESKTDEEKETFLFEKYLALRDSLIQKCNVPPPSKLSDYGTENDLRTIALPDKLKNSSGEIIYMIPTGISMSSCSPSLLEYVVSLRECVKFPCKVSIDGDIIDDATVTIVCRKPRISSRYFAFSSGGEHYFSGFENRKYKVDGILNSMGGEKGEGELFYDKQREKADAIVVSGVVNLGIISVADEEANVFSCIDIENFSFSGVTGLTETRISIEGEERESI